MAYIQSTKRAVAQFLWISPSNCSALRHISVHSGGALREWLFREWKELQQEGGGGKSQFLNWNSAYST